MIIITIIMILIVLVYNQRLLFHIFLLGQDCLQTSVFPDLLESHAALHSQTSPSIETRTQMYGTTAGHYVQLQRPRVDLCLR